MTLHVVRKVVNFDDVNCGPPSDNSRSDTVMRQNWSRRDSIRCGAVVSLPKSMLSGQSVLQSIPSGIVGLHEIQCQQRFAEMVTLVGAWKSKVPCLGTVDDPGNNDVRKHSSQHHGRFLASKV